VKKLRFLGWTGVALFALIFVAWALLTGFTSGELAAEAPEPTPSPEINVISLEPTVTASISLTPPPTQDPNTIVIDAYELNATDVLWLARLAYLSPLYSIEYKAALMWLVLNRVDSEDFPNTVQLVISQNSRSGSGGEFGFWDEDKFIQSDHLEENIALATLVLNQWLSEKDGLNSGRPIPESALFICFTGENNRNLELLSERGGVPLYYPIRGAYDYD